MPLYLVRWPDLSASLVRARSVSELLDRLDEVGDPGECTWSEYHGPLWIDFELDAECHRVEGDGVAVVRPPPPTGRRLVPRWPEGSDTAYATEEELLGGAFPAVARAYAAADEDGPPAADLAGAVRADVVRHARRVAGRGVTSIDEGEDYRLIPTATWYFRWREGKGFVRIAPARLDAFVHGRRALRGDADRHVRVAVVEVEHEGRRRVGARLVQALRLGVGPDGHIAPAHRADDAPLLVHTDRLIHRRNEVVQWTLDAAQRRALLLACARLAPDLPVEIEP